MDFKSFRRSTHCALKEPAVELKLEANLLVMVFIHFPRKLGVADYVPVPGADEEVRTPDDNDRAPADCGLVLKLTLINHGSAIPYGFQGSEDSLASLYDTHVLVSTQRG
jgi:hypothetical protein